MRHDNGFQGIRPLAYGDVWDRMSSRDRRFAFKWDLVVGCGGAALFWWNPKAALLAVAAYGLFWFMMFLRLMYRRAR